MATEQGSDPEVAVVVVDGEQTLACVVVNSVPGSRTGIEVSTSVNGLSKAGMAYILRDLATKWEQDAAIEALHG
jgi:hypothetical protein